jgi:hypothetical protein
MKAKALSSLSRKGIRCRRRNSTLKTHQTRITQNLKPPDAGAESNVELIQSGEKIEQIKLPAAALTDCLVTLFRAFQLKAGFIVTPSV